MLAPRFFTRPSSAATASALACRACGAKVVAGDLAAPRLAPAGDLDDAPDALSCGGLGPGDWDVQGASAPAAGRPLECGLSVRVAAENVAAAAGAPTVDVPRFLLAQGAGRVARHVACGRCDAPLGLRFAGSDAALYKHRLRGFPGATAAAFLIALMVREADARHALAFDLRGPWGRRLLVRLVSWTGHAGTILAGAGVASLAPVAACAFRNDGEPDGAFARLDVDADDLAALAEALENAHAREPADASPGWRLGKVEW